MGYENSVTEEFIGNAFEDSLGRARAMLELEAELLDPNAGGRTPAAPEKLAELGRRAVELARALSFDFERFAALDARLASERFLERVLSLPLWLAEAGDVGSALSVARAFDFVAFDLLRGDEALILARAGRREDALALVAANLVQAQDIPTAESKAGDTYRALGEADSAEAYYRRALAVSATARERTEAVLRLVSLFSDQGRLRDASDVLHAEQRLALERSALAARTAAKVGRNQRCPCGSGKKYKKCHGAEA